MEEVSEEANEEEIANEEEGDETQEDELLPISLDTVEYEPEVRVRTGMYTCIIDI